MIAAVLPMLFVSGLMGPYMSPMPIRSTVAMTFSLLVALIGTPWLAFRLLRGAAAMFAIRGVAVKMLPFDDKNEMQVIIDMPEGTPLEATTALATDIGRALAEIPEIHDLQVYAGTAAPFNFNGMIRHYYLRRGAHVADIQVNLVAKSERGDQSHDIAKRVRPVVRRVADASGTGAWVKVVEVPPGPPVLSTLVAEVYGPDAEIREEVARRVRGLFAEHPSVVDVGWSLSAPQREVEFVVDEELAALSGVARASVVGALWIGLAGEVATHLSEPAARTPVPVRLRLEEGDRSGARRLAGLHVLSRTGRLVPVGEVVRVEESAVPL